jgi:phosphohistidine phosphatase
MLIYIIRHAWAHDRGDPRFMTDAQRPLTDDGADRFSQVALRLVKRGVHPHHIATSPLMRCRETADILAAQMSPQPEVSELDALAPGSDLAALIRWTRHQGNRSGGDSSPDVAWVGHMPDVSDLTTSLIGDPTAQLRFAKGAAACVRFHREISPGSGSLQWLVTAKILGC